MNDDARLAGDSDVKTLRDADPLSPRDSQARRLGRGRLVIGLCVASVLLTGCLPARGLLAPEGEVAARQSAHLIQTDPLNAVFGIATMLIGVPTGVKVYDWLLTMWRGRIRFTAPMLFAAGFIFSFVIGGVTGVILANPPVDFAVHNSLFLVAHFHNMLIPGLLFGMIAGMQFWFPKAFGFRLEERFGIVAFFLFFLGFHLAFLPLYILGLMGAPRRVAIWHDADFTPWLHAAGLGALFVAGGFAALIVQIRRSVARRASLAVPVGDPWDGRSLEWALPCPAPDYNFARRPQVSGQDTFWQDKAQGIAYDRAGPVAAIEMPARSAAAPLIGLAAFLTGFGLTWHIWWLAVVATSAGIMAWIGHSFRRDTMERIPVARIEANLAAWHDQISAASPVDRHGETSARNTGLAKRPT
ncbi:cbb3-type cytochrome c oxidase subunit I [Celeribacter indicus]|uniref:Cytochrome-c oxidase n=1 Tax=Celeribacter indicus TaxID=1208324 RepID=A0A0B5E067_9RHOB|nr:cbb3-type cytochrome c oxidase subunit I [Celeribacter indicus]AJE49088.1 cytochrome-c oxidase [Celeribacter indicus]SDW45574.1 cytochrome o ubiquinol oxidase subunit 1 [Celeribacter indicus]